MGSNTNGPTSKAHRSNNNPISNEPNISLDPNKGGGLLGPVEKAESHQKGEKRSDEGESMEVAEDNEVPTNLVRLSQIPGVSLMVDLNNVDCRRRRIKHMSNLLLIQERMENNSEVVENSVASTNDSIESVSAIEREVRASLVVGEALGINCVPNSEEMMHNLIEMEAHEYSLNLEREANR